MPSNASSRLDALSGVAGPTLVVHGTADPLFPLDHAEATADAIAGSTLVPWDGVGHEQPPALMADLAARVLSQIASSG